MFCNTLNNKFVFKFLSRNPCFSGQCFAIREPEEVCGHGDLVAILVLVDSVLQSVTGTFWRINKKVAILVLVDSVLQF